MIDFKKFMEFFEEEKGGYWEITEKQEYETAEEYSERIERLVEDRILDILKIYTEWLNNNI